MAIGLVRIDDRLIHGQVATAWISAVGASRIVISSDEVANDSFQREVIDFTKPSDLLVDVLTTQQTIEMVRSGQWDGEKIFVICKNAKDALDLVNGEIGINYINIGNIGGSSNKKLGELKRLYKSIMVSEEDLVIFKQIVEKNVKVEIQIVPGDATLNIAKFIE
jgi:PTS system mannose-specific IIB component